MRKTTSTRREGPLAIVTIDNPPVNALSAAVRAEILAAIESLGRDPSVEAVLIVCAGRTFVAGADIREFDAGVADPAARQVMSAVERCPHPVIAALHGTALGAGAELALACHYRCAARNAKIGLPELTLGIIPGAGGTQRLPRLIGARRALELILSAAPITAEEALRIGLIDRLVPEDLLCGAEAYARELIAQRAPPRPTCALAVDANGFDDAFIEQSLAAAGKRMRGQHAPSLAAQAVRAAIQLPFETGLEREAEIARRQVQSDEAKALRHLFFAERAAARVPGLSPSVRALTIQRLGIIGAGTMGSGIAAACADAGFSVELIEARPEALSRGLALEAVNDVDLVIEAVHEDLELKRQIFGRLGSLRCAGALLASATSTLDLDELGAASGRPESVVGLHFFRPAQAVRLLEIIRGSRTSDEAIATALAFAKRLHKIGVVVRKGAGRMMLDAQLREAQRLRLEGAAPQQVDRVLEAFGFAMGPFAMSDRAGLDAALRARESSGIEDLARRVGDARRTVNDEEIEARCVYPLINEGAKILAEGIAYRPGDIDVISTAGCGFPRFRGGPLFYADTLGLTKTCEEIARLHAQLGSDWQPAPLLKELARSGRTFAEWSGEKSNERH